MQSDCTVLLSQFLLQGKTRLVQCRSFATMVLSFLVHDASLWKELRVLAKKILLNLCRCKWVEKKSFFSPSNSFMTHFVCLFVDFEWESSSTFSISVSLKQAKRLFFSNSSTASAHFMSKSSLHQSGISSS